MSLRRQLLTYLLLGIFGYSIFLLLTIPAATAYNIADGRGWLPEQVEAEAISGTIMTGRAARVRINHTLLHDLSWQLKPLRLLQGRARYEVSFQHPQGHGHGDVSLGFGDIRAYQVRAELPAADAARMFATPPVALGGQMLLDASRLAWRYDGRISYADGVLGWLDAAAGFPRAHPIGNLRADMSTDDAGTVHALIQDQDAQLGVYANVLLYPDGRYELQAQIEPGTNVPTELRAVLRLLGSPNPDGRYHLGLSGTLTSEN